MPETNRADGTTSQAGSDAIPIKSNPSSSSPDELWATAWEHPDDAVADAAFQKWLLPYQYLLQPHIPPNTQFELRI